jgi:hypothetical protein
MASVPVIIDDVKRLDGFEMTRCIYFQIECEDTLDEWTLRVGNTETPFLMLGLSGIITQPLSGSGVFGGPQEIEELFAFIENFQRPGWDEPHMYVEIADVWLPNHILERDRIVSRGDVYRVRYEFFQSAFAFTVGRLRERAFIRRALDARNEVVFAENETYIFGDWVKREISRSYESRHRELHLPSKDRQV